jgi:hypothetical protein
MSIPEEAIEAYLRARFGHLLDGPSAEHLIKTHRESGSWEHVRAGLGAAAPLIAAQVLREAAQALDDTGEKLHTYAAMDWAAAWLRERADAAGSP